MNRTAFFLHTIIDGNKAFDFKKPQSKWCNFNNAIINNDYLGEYTKKVVSFIIQQGNEREFIAMLTAFYLSILDILEHGGLPCDFCVSQSASIGSSKRDGHNATAYQLPIGSGVVIEAHDMPDGSSDLVYYFKQ